MKTNIAFLQKETIKNMKQLLTLFICLSVISVTYAQDDIPVNYDFADFRGNGLGSPAPAGGLDNTKWQINGVVGGAAPGGTTLGGETVGGVYSLVDDIVTPTDGAIWFESSAFFLNDVHLTVCNNSGATMTDIQVQYDVKYLNEGSRSQECTYSWRKVGTSSDTDISSATVFTPLAADALGIQTVSRDFTISGINLLDGECLYSTFRFNENTGTGGRDEMGIDNIVISDPAVLPVALTSFEVNTIDNEATKVKWTTASEVNNDYFSVEHSTGGYDFQEIARKTGKGNTEINQEYHFIHDNLRNGLHYYRLKQVDFDGTFVYSDLATASVHSFNEELLVMPNPASDVLFIKMKNPIEKGGDFQISNTQGEVVLSDKWNAGTTQLELNISELPSGVYYLQFLADNNRMSKKIIKL